MFIIGRRRDAESGFSPLGDTLLHRTPNGGRLKSGLLVPEKYRNFQESVKLHLFLIDSINALSRKVRRMAGVRCFTAYGDIGRAYFMGRKMEMA
jgi:hypothetical protein